MGVHFFENVDHPPTDIIQIFENIVSPSTLILPPKNYRNHCQFFFEILILYNIFRDGSITPTGNRKYPKKCGI